ncbi:MAG TPA: hydrogenase maturation nickel metallochaperone HypA [Gemmatimonadales bacterium]|nr:hydrogenase maturation nickel metallochaperone HypA [Gemmatimonadales bacterium]
MHELSIAMSLVDAACEERRRLGAVRVQALRVRLGALSGVVPDALLFAFDLAVSDSEIAGARLEIEEVPVVIHCGTCGEERPLAGIQHFRCPVCNTPAVEVRSGRELQLVALEVFDMNPGEVEAHHDAPANR